MVLDRSAAEPADSPQNQTSVIVNDLRVSSP